MNEILDKLEQWLEAFAIRFLHVLHATSLKRRPGLCPPQCSEGHTYRWPCRARIHRPIKSKIGVYRDDPKRFYVGTDISIDDEAVVVVVEETPVGYFVHIPEQASEAHHGAPPKEKS